MSANEVIEEIKKLPAEEQEKVLDFVHALEAGRGVDHSSFEASAKWAVDEHRELLRRLAQ